MEVDFWIKAWDEGRTNFHQDIFNQKLIKYFPLFNPEVQHKVLVPLCGKTKDLIWLKSQKLQVHGIELHHKAIKDFFIENDIPEPKGTQNQKFTTYTHENLSLSCGDFFDFNEKNQYDFVYDRAALVALPEEMRKNYSKLIKDSIKEGGKYLLIVYQYDQSKMAGPPFSIDENEINKLFKEQFNIQLLESCYPETQNNNKLSTLDQLIEKVYFLEKRG